MKRFLVSAAGGFVLMVSVGLAWLSMRKPASRPAVNVSIERTEERLRRGKYLYESVAHCDGCHGERGAGFVFPKEMGLPGVVAAANISSDLQYGVGAWTDGELLRAIREGISRDGHGLFPMMPYQNYRKMSDQDAYALVAFVRTIPASQNKVAATRIRFPVNLMVKGAPQPVTEPVAAPEESDRVKYGEYLATLAGKK